MKTEQEFITGMWTEIAAIEYEAEQKRKVHELNRRLFFKNVIIYATIAAVFIAGSLIAFFAEPSIMYAVVFFVLSIAFFAERALYTRPQEAYINENRN